MKYLKNSAGLFLAPQEVKKKDSVEVATITAKSARREFRSFLEAKTRSIKWCVIGESFEVVMNQQIDFIKTNVLSHVFISLVVLVSEK